MMKEISLPAEFCSRMQTMLSEEDYRAFLASYRRKRLFSLRINPLKCGREQALNLLKKAYAGYNADADADTEGEGPAQAGPVFAAVPWEPDGFYYPEAFRPGRLAWHEAGMYYIQEASAMAPARLCGALPGDRVLDLCAAPGGKSTKLAADLKGQGLLVCNEIHPERAKVLSANIERMGVRNALVTSASPQELASCFPLFFDRIVVDAPCSGEGMFRKEEDALLHWSPENVRTCADRQRGILEEAAAMLRGGGTLVYSTCTFAPEENEGVLAFFLRDHPEFSVVDIRQMPGVDTESWGFAPGQPAWAAGSAATGSAEDAGDPSASLAGTVRLWPHRLEGEGHFAAVLRKEGRLRPEAMPAAAASANGAFIESGKTKNGKNRLEKHGKNGKDQRGKREKAAGKGRRRDPREAELLRLWQEFAEDTLWPEESDSVAGSPAASDDGQEKRKELRAFSWKEANFHCFGDTLYALPLPADSLSLDGLRVLRAGLQLGSTAKGRFVPSHSLGMTLHMEEVQRSVNLLGTGEEAYAWIRGETIPLAPECAGWKGWVLVCIDGCAAGWGKAAGGILKNHYPKGLRKGSSYHPH